MDKRFFLALLLTAAVVLITPVLFPPAKRAPQPGRRSDSAAAARRGDTSRAGAQVAPAAQPPAGRSASDTAPSTRPTPAVAAGATAVPAAPVETTSIVLPNATYRFSSRGAALISAEMTHYRSLRRDVGSADVPVELARRGEPLLRYRLFTGRDTIALDSVAFRVEPRAATA